MRDGIQGLGWFVRRTQDPIMLGRFYHEALGLPVLRQWDTPEDAGFVMYAGDITVLEIGRGGQPPPDDPLKADCTPIFRTRGRETALKRVELAGGKPVGEEGNGPRHTIFFTDPLGHLVGLREGDAASTLAPDAEAEGRRLGAAPDAAALGSLSEFLQGLGWVRLAAADPIAASDFYQVALGLDVLAEPTEARGLLHFGGTASLDIRAGGKRRNPPKDRVEVTDSWILRIYDYIGLKAHLAVEGANKINTLQQAGGWLDTYADPEGHLFGIQERRPPDPAVPDTNLPEDAAARQRWEQR